VSVAGGITAFWEILEAWIVIFFYKTQGPEWLGWQGDIWDAQNDMTMALTAAILAMVFLTKMQDRSVAKVLRKERVTW
jgi:putative membrane protein